MTIHIFSMSLFHLLLLFIPMSQDELLSVRSIGDKSGKMNQWRDWRKKMISCWRHREDQTNHWGAKWLTRIFQLQRKLAKTFFLVLFTASGSHFYIQPEGLWQIMCQGFMMWDVIGPPSWWSKWMCISQTVTSTHLLSSRWKWKCGAPHSHWPYSLCNHMCRCNACANWISST